VHRGKVVCGVESFPEKFFYIAPLRKSKKFAIIHTKKLRMFRPMAGVPTTLTKKGSNYGYQEGCCEEGSGEEAGR
jgi:hypothetical protein